MGHNARMAADIANILKFQDCSKELWICGSYDKIIANVTKVQYLPLERLRFVCSQESFYDIINTFQNLSSNLKRLSVNYSKINSEAADVITSLIPNLNSLELFGGIQTDELIKIINAVEKSKLHTLKLGELVTEGRETVALVNCITKSQLNKLFIRGYFGCGSLESIINVIARSTLQTLILHHAIFDIVSTNAIINCLKNSSLAKTPLIKLSLQECTFVDNKIWSITKAIRKSSIQILDLRYNKFTDDIGGIMEHVANSSVIKLYLGSFYRVFDVEEIISIANSVKANDKLKAFGLNHVPINDQTISIICDMIENSALTAVRLRHCNLECSHVAKICVSIKKSSVMYLDLSGNSLTNEGVAAICDLLETYKLDKLKVMYCDINNESIEAMLVSIKKSKLMRFDIDCDNVRDETIKGCIMKVMYEQNMKQ